MRKTRDGISASIGGGTAKNAIEEEGDCTSEELGAKKLLRRLYTKEKRKKENQISNRRLNRPLDTKMKDHRPHKKRGN